MPAAVPALARGGRILAEMSSDPNRPYSAAELGNIVGIHRATAQSLLGCLAEMGMVVRDASTKLYRLGPELVRLGRASAEQYRGLDLVRRELCLLTEALDVGGLACVRVGDEQLIVDQVGDDDPEFGLPTARAARVELIPPVGGIFYAWASIEEIEGWIARCPESTTDEDRESYRRMVTTVRARGFSIGGEVEFELQLEEVLDTLSVRSSTSRLTAALRLADLVRREALAHRGVSGSAGGGPPANDPYTGTHHRRRPGRIDHIIAPIFDSLGNVARSITLFGRPGQITDANLPIFSGPLLDAVERLTRAQHGRWPDITARIGA